nr:hypothetical protein [Tanacetum cinerariifolium]
MTSMPSGSLLLGGKRQQFYGFAINQESARDVYSKRRIITVTELKIVEWHSYKYLDWITVRTDDDKLYKFKEGDFKRLRIQDIKDMLLLLVQGKLNNLTVEERFAFNNEDKKNRLIRIDELHKFSDGMLIDVRTALDDRLKGIRIENKGIVSTEMELILEHTQQGTSHEVSIHLTKARNPVKKILLKLNLSDHRKLKDRGEVPGSSCLTNS